MQKLLKPEEVAKILRLSPSTIRRKARLKEIPHIRIGQTIRFSPKHLEEEYGISIDDNDQTF